MSEPAPTYYVQAGPDGKPLYYCLYCEQQGTGHWASDFELFTFHMQQRHDGRLTEATPEQTAEIQAAQAEMAQAARAPEDHPQGGPPGQTGERPHGGPPGQTGEHPENEPTPHPEQPIVLPEEPEDGEEQPAQLPAEPPPA